MTDPLRQIERLRRSKTKAVTRADLDERLAASGGGGSSAWASITGKPATFPPETHVHAQSDVTGLVAALAAKAAASHTHASGEITDFAEAVDDRLAALLVAGANITLTYNDVAGTLTIAASGGGGGASPALAWVI